MSGYTSVDGVPLLTAPYSGKLRAGLVFRVGSADETLAVHGITELVTRLALHHLDQPDFDYGVGVGADITQFQVQGPPEAVAGFLGGVCRALGDLPLHRLEAERELLYGESLHRSRGVNGDMALWRHGARDYGLGSYAPWGVRRVGADEVRRWAAEWFTSANASVWVAGDVPAGLSLPLAPGVRKPLPPQSSALPKTPAWFHGPSGGVVLDGVVSRSTAARLFTDVFERALYRELRQEGGISYAVSTDYSPYGAGSAMVTAFADALRENEGALAGAFVEVLRQLSKGRIDPADLDAARTKTLRALEHPDVEAGTLPSAAASVLTGYAFGSVAQVRAELAEVTVPDLAAVAGQVLETALLQVPFTGARVEVGFDAAPVASTARVTGRSVKSASGDGSVLAIGADGVSVLRGDSAATVYFKECAARLDFPDGARHFVGADGIIVRVEPTIFPVTPQDQADLAAAVAPELAVPMPARPADQIPRPGSGQPLPQRDRGRRRKIELAVTVAVMIVLTWLFIDSANAWTPADGEFTEKVILAEMIAALVAFLRAAVILWPRMQTGRW
ncbi:hypothetical protein Cs7R123_00400 [Catellatospora sp. TT07R-123]|uniref:insulinase family protein n=1 Tax=Catellatospora sp. TT07R-123 TaxID=2733863 RepID=UPI001B0DAC6C|nr:insulinase family protein [Catellatospora sp. TT07R-123]GHJ42698.1 hypothetical protein Cs7R123_00400 [Catellatospora sp. TT07R-123]